MMGGPTNEQSDGRMDSRQCLSYHSPTDILRTLLCFLPPRTRSMPKYILGVTRNGRFVMAGVCSLEKAMRFLKKTKTNALVIVHFSVTHSLL